MRARRLRLRRLAALAAVAAGSAAIGLLAYGTDLFRPLELSTIDARFSIRGAKATPPDLAVVQIDDKTFSELGLQWPFPRHVHARLIDRLRAAGVRQIAYDVQFTEPTEPREDNALIRSVKRAGHVVLSTTEVNAHGQSNVFGGEQVLRAIGARAANTVVQPDPGGVLRKFPLSFDGLTGFAVASVEAASGAPVRRAGLDESHTAWIDYRGPPGTIRTFSFADVLRGAVPDRALRGSTVVVGAASPSLKDVHSTPASGGHEMSGSEVQANAIWTVEHGFPLRSPLGVLAVLLIVLMAVAPPLANLRLPPFAALGFAGALGAAYLVAAQLAFDGGRILSVVYPTGTLAVSAVGALAVTTVMTAFERQWVHDTFSRFVPEAVVDELMARTDGDPRLGGVRREGTVLFSDLRGFTSFSETLEPDQVVDVLNRYLSEMSDAIMEHGGTLVSYMGDGIMAIFGAPIEQADHADLAVAAAREMLEVRLPQFNRWMHSQGLGEGFEMGIGLNSGVVMSGQVGSERRLEYTAIGDTTNTAARLEGMTKDTPHQVFVADSTMRLLSNQDGLAFVDEFPVRGREATIRVWTLGDRQVPPPSSS